MPDPHKAVMKLVEEDEEVYEISHVEGLESALQACWDEYHELMPDALYEQVKKALDIKVFEAKVGEHIDGTGNAS